MQPDAREILVDISKTRTPEQLAEYERIEADGICPFCPEHRAEYADGESISQGPDWWLFENNWPYKNTRRHVIAVTQQHATYFEDVNPAVAADLFHQLSQIEEQEDYALAAIDARFGFVLWTGASVAHLHVHLIVPEQTQGNSHVESYELGEQVQAGTYWDVYHAGQPHEHAREHLLIVSKHKGMYLRDLRQGAEAELFTLLRELESEFDMTHGGIHMRLGERQQTGDAVGKLVVELIAPLDDIADDPIRKVRMTISQDPPVSFKIST